MLRNSLLAALVNYVRVVMQLPEYGCQFSCNTKGCTMCGVVTDVEFKLLYYAEIR